MGTFPRAAGPSPAARSRVIYSPARRAPLQQWDREYAFRKFQAKLPNCVLPHARKYAFRQIQAPSFRILYSLRGGPSPAARVGVPNSPIVYSPLRRAPPGSTRGNTLFASFRPQTPELNCVFPRVAGRLRGSTLFASFRPQTPELYSLARRAPPQQHAWEYTLRQFSAPNRGGSLLWSTLLGPLPSSTRGPKLPNCALPRAARVGVCFSQASGIKLPIESCTPPRGGPQQHQQHTCTGVYFSQVSGPKLPNSVLPSAARVGVRFSQASGFKLPNRVLPRAAGHSPAARVGIRFSQVSGPKLPNRVLPCVAGPSPPQQHAWEYAFRKLQAANCRIV